MFKSVIVSLLAASSVLSQNGEHKDSKIDESINSEVNIVNEFLLNHIFRAKEAVNYPYHDIEADELRNHVSNYLEYQKNKLATDVRRYVQHLKDSNTMVTDLMTSFIPTTYHKSKMENPDTILSVPAIISRNGYDCETHTIISQGYVLNIHRMPRPKQATKHGVTFQETVILHHGLFDSSFGWIINGPEKSLAYALSEAGYDVWMANARGNIHVRENAWYKTDTKEFWNFSFHEIAQYDVPALIDYIRGVKGNDTKIAYIGHSMGTTILFSMLSLRPEYNDKLSVGIALAPAVFMSNVKYPLKAHVNLVTSIANATTWRRSYEVLPKDFFETVSFICKDVYGAMETICQHNLFQLVGDDKEQLNETVYSNYLSKGSSASWKTVVHYVQLMSSGEFKQFDYGGEDFNRQVYGSETPPHYDLSKVKLNLTIFWAENDVVVHEKDVMRLYEKLPRSTQLFKVPFEKFNHADYLWAKDAPALVNHEILKILDKTMKSQYYN